MSDSNHHSDEPEEQIDLEGDNEEEDLIEDDERDQFNDYDPREDPDEDDEQGPESGQDGDGGRDEMAEDKQDDERVGPEDEEERKKWDELMALPPHGAEVFIGGLPREIIEEDLRELCDPFGEIYEVCYRNSIFNTVYVN
jgi:heterogeneous nuclear ribonucleoprotein R